MNEDVETRRLKRLKLFETKVFIEKNLFLSKKIMRKRKKKPQNDEETFLHFQFISHSFSASSTQKSTEFFIYSIYFQINLHLFVDIKREATETPAMKIDRACREYGQKWKNNKSCGWRSEDERNRVENNVKMFFIHFSYASKSRQLSNGQKDRKKQRVGIPC